jgi:small subunit ribosomal protein S21
MIIVKVKNENSIEQALKEYKFKVYKTKQLEKLKERKEYKKPSVERRAQIQKAIYNQKNYSAD